MKKIWIPLLLIAFASVFLVVILFSFGGNKDYLLSFSLNDKNTGEQYTTLEDALEKGNEICNKYSKDHTQSTKFAGKQNDDGTLDNKQTVIYEFHEMSEDDMDAMKDEFETIFPQAEITVTEK